MTAHGNARCHHGGNSDEVRQNGAFLFAVAPSVPSLGSGRALQGLVRLSVASEDESSREHPDHGQWK